MFAVAAMAVLGAVALQLTPGQDGTRDARNDIPDADSQKKSTEDVRRLFAKEYANTDPVERRKFARKLFDTGKDTQNKSDRYVLFAQARAIAFAAGDLMFGLDVVDQLAAEYKVDVSKAIVEELDRVLPLGYLDDDDPAATFLKAIVDVAKRRQADPIALTSEFAHNLLRAPRALVSLNKLRVIFETLSELETLPSAKDIPAKKVAIVERTVSDERYASRTSLMVGVAELVMSGSERYASGDDYAAGRVLLPLAARAAANSKDKPTMAAVAKVQGDLARREQKFSEYAVARDTLKKDPRSATAHRIVGTYLYFEKRDLRGLESLRQTICRNGPDGTIWPAEAETCTCGSLPPHPLGSSAARPGTNGTGPPKPR